MLPLTILFGAIVGFSLGLTGGGGSLFAVPLLVYGLGVEPFEAAGISLAAVGATAAVGLFDRLRAGEVEIVTGLVFAAGGMAGAPIGSRLGAAADPRLLLTAFAVIMGVVAVRMWIAATRRPHEATAVRARIAPIAELGPGPACRRGPQGDLFLNSRCAALLAVVGLATGVLSGIFGVGGGFVIVPALVVMARMEIHRAVATSLLVIVAVSISGVASRLMTDSHFDARLTALFTVGGLVGMLTGTRVGRRLTGPGLQKVFAAAIVLLAIYMVVRPHG